MIRTLHTVAATCAAISAVVGGAQAQTPEEIASVLQDYAAAWATRDPAALRVFWDAGDDAPLYVAEEVDHALSTWPEIEAYWAGNEQAFSGLAVSFGEARLKPLGEGETLALFDMRWDAAFAAPGASSIGGDNRVLALLRRTEEGWRLASWVEAPLAPLPYLRRLLTSPRAFDHEEND